MIRNRYDNEVVKLMRKFEKLDFKYRIKVLLDLVFLDNCIRNDVVILVADNIDWDNKDLTGKEQI